MLKKISVNALTIFFVSSLVLTMQTPKASAGDGGAFAAGAIIGGVLGAITATTAGTNRRVHRTSKRHYNPVTSAQREENKRIQEALNLYGFNVGRADGALGKKSRAGISQFQAVNGFTPTGQLTEVEKQMLLSTPFQVENALFQNGYSVGLVDGKVDQQTLIAISQFQTQIGQIPSGTLTPDQTRLLISQQQQQQQQQIMVQKQAPALQGNSIQNVALAPNSMTLQQDQQNLATKWPAIEPDQFNKGRGHKKNAVAVIIGNKHYSGQDIPDVEFAERDALAMKYAFTNSLGIPEENIIYLEDATLSELVDTFGNDTPNGSRLWSYIDPDGSSDIFVYYSGHGIPSMGGDNNQAQAYIAPTDVTSTSSTQSSYSLKKLYKNLQALPSKSVTMFIDACFSGAAGNGDMIIQAASPIVIPAYAPTERGELNVFAAAEADQIASWDEKDGHGIFTKHLLDGLNGDADEDSDSAISTGELEDYLSKQVHRTARRSWRRDQTPTFEGDNKLVLVNY
nr:caspase family protein [uncultured Cohaesibacter sp.]